MSDIYFRVWDRVEKKMYYRGYQKVTHILLCEDDGGSNEGRGTPVRRASYDDCDMMQGTGITDQKGREVFEGDVVQIRTAEQEIQGEVESVPDMYKSRNLHPLHCVLAEHGLADDVEILEVKILRNRYENE